MYDRRAPGNQPHTEEADDGSGSLFRVDELFAGYDVTMGGDPGYSSAGSPGNPVDTEPSWVTAPPRSSPAPIAASTPAEGADSIWRLWPQSGPASIAIALPNGGDIRSLWLPSVPFPFSISLSIAGSPMYSVTMQGGEIIPIPAGTNLVVLSASPTILRNDLWVYATADKFDPNKTGVQGPPLPIATGQLSPYDQLVLLGNPGWYWPCSDPNGSLYAQDYGPNKQNANVEGSMGFAGAPLLNDGTASATFPGLHTAYLSLPVVPPAGDFTVEFWFNVAAFGDGTDNAVPLWASSASAGRYYVNVLRNNSDLEWKTPGVDTGVQVLRGSHYLVYTHLNSGTDTLFLDGKQIAQGSATGALGGAPGFCMGDGVNDGTAGNMSKIAYYNRVLSLSEILQRWGYHL